MKSIKGHSKGSDGLTNAERHFLTLYFLTKNKRRSAMEAFGLNVEKTADMAAIRTIKKAQSKAYLDTLVRDSQGSEGTVAEQAKKVIKELDIISFNDIRDYVDQLALPETLKKSLKNVGESARAISEIEFDSVSIPNTDNVQTRIKIKFHNKIQALTKLGEHHKLYTQLVDINAKVESPVKWVLPDNGMSDESK